MKNPVKAVILALAGIFLVLYVFSLPQELFKKDHSTVVFSREGELLGASIASDGQWRFPVIDSVPRKLETCVLTFEDRHFRKHPGLNPISLWKAFLTNRKAGEIKRGGSTITMQVIRLSRENPPRTYFEKIKEIVLATRLEWRYSKDRILELYLSHAPFGGNVVGLETASWRYFGRPSNQLSWAESAFLAVLPNAPGLLHPGRNRDALVAKRNRLLGDLYSLGKIDSITHALSLLETLPEKPKPLPNHALHLVQRFMGQENLVHTTLQNSIQEKIYRIGEVYGEKYSGEEVHNMAILVMDVETGEVLGYLGNSPNASLNNERFVDMIPAKRSSGSILKPFLFTAQVQAAEITPDGLVADLPTNYAGYTPENYNKTYAGAISAGNSLAKSLNVPAVRALKKYGVSSFLHDLKSIGFTSFEHSADHYGLSLILGGGEVSLFEAAGAYASLGRILNRFTQDQAQYRKESIHPPSLLIDENSQAETYTRSTPFQAGAIWHCLEVLSELKRPREENGHEKFSSHQKIAWKTGTSFGHRDAWSIGLNKDLLVAVWVGNADGEGRPGLTGTSKAAPIMFEVFRHLPGKAWFQTPYDDLEMREICTKSGYLAAPHCPEIDSLYLPRTEKTYPACTFHKLIHLNENQNRRVNAACYRVHDMVSKAWFQLPPAMEWYYTRQHSDYKKVPPFLESCQEQERSMAILYPEKGSIIYIPKVQEGREGAMVAEATHRRLNTTIYWHLDQTYLGSTRTLHNLDILVKPGNHTLSLVDEYGNTQEVNFQVE